MGANGLETAHNQQELNYFLDSLQQQYLPLSNVSTDGEDLKWFVHKNTGEKFIFKKIQTNSQQQALALNQIVLRKMEAPCQSVTKLHSYSVQKIKKTCNTEIAFYLLFELQNHVSLSRQIANRVTKALKFSEKELIQGLKSLIKAILWFKSIFKQSYNRTIWNICPENIYYLNGHLCLSDPWISQFTTQQSLKYPSHQRLLFMSDQVQDFDRDAQQVFEVGMTILQMAKLKNMRNVYSKKSINFNLLVQEVQKCEYLQLKGILTQLLLGDAQKRKQYFHSLEGKPKQKIVRFQKQKMVSRIQTNKKIKLAKYQNQNHCKQAFEQPKKEKEFKKFKQIEQRIPLQQKNKNTQITFTYIPFLNAQKLEFRPIQNQIHSVHRCIEKINENLQNIQNLVSQNITKNTLISNVVESKIIASNNEYSQHLQTVKQQKANEEYSKVDVPHTHAEQSQTNWNKLVQQKDSLHVMMQQFQQEQHNRLSQSYNEVTYTVNVNQVRTQTSEPILQSEIQENSFQIRDYPSEDTCGYIFKMQGTQLQGVSKLTIPEQQSEEEKSLDEGIQKSPKGQYVVQRSQKGGTYQGYMNDNKRNGLGTFYYLQGGYYEGNWKDNRMNGYGKIYYDSGELAYQGMWYQDQIHGRGKFYNDSAEPLSELFNYKNLEYEECHVYEVSYEGDFSHDLRQGFGKLTLSNGEFYSGQFHENNPHGKGYFNGLKTSVYGLWQNGIFIKPL